MARIPLDHPATYDDLVALPDIVVAEIVDGELHASPRPAPAHAIAGSLLGATLIPAYWQGRGGPGGWWRFNKNATRDGFVGAGWGHPRRQG